MQNMIQVSILKLKISINYNQIQKKKIILSNYTFFNKFFFLLL